jgi:hypothetical protein
MSTTANFVNGYALIIGVGKDLPVTVQDAETLKNLLVNPAVAAYPENQVRLLIEEKASRTGILTALAELKDSANKNQEATVLVYFSGHGGRILLPDGTSKYHLVPHDYDPSNSSETSVSGAEFTALIQGIQAKKLVVLLDCCHAGGIPAVKEPGATFVKSPVPPELFALLDSGKGMIIIASSREDEVSYTGDPLSLFTACLIEALRGQASVAKDGFARVLDVHIYLFDQVPKRSSNNQHPFLKKALDLGDNFPLCYYASGKGVSQESDSSLTLSATPHGSSLSASARARRQQQTPGLQQEWDLLVAKLARLRAALAIETGTAVKFQLEQQILEVESTLAELSNKIDRLED